MSDARQATVKDFNEEDRMILSMLADHHDPEEIAEILGIPLETAEQRIAYLVSKLSARNTGQAVTTAILMGLIGPGANREPAE